MDEKLELLTNGADDYITKPFNIDEVLARVKIQLRHAGNEKEDEKIKIDGFELDIKTHQIWIEGKELKKLTRQEFEILRLLAQNSAKKQFLHMRGRKNIWAKQKHSMCI